MFPWAQEKGWPVTRIGFEKVYYRNLKRENTPPEFFAVNFDRQFYEEANILFKERYDKFTLPKEIPGSDEVYENLTQGEEEYIICLLYTSPSPRDLSTSRMPSSA